MPGKDGTVRGFSGVRLLCIDEAAWVTDDLYLSVLPMLAVSQGRLVAMSTPHGTRGWFYESWRGQEPWQRYEIPATQCPRIPAAFLEEQKRKMGEWFYAQEFECQFSENASQAFRAEDVERAFREEVTPWDL